MVGDINGHSMIRMYQQQEASWAAMTFGDQREQQASKECLNLGLIA
jgi:hypothetical protein